MLQQRYIILTFIVGAVMTGLALQAAAVDAFEVFALADNRLAGLVATTTVVGLLGGAGTFFALLRNRQAVKFTGEVISELAKTTWPSRDETVQATTTVIFTTLFVAALLGVYDLIWKNLADVFLFTSG